MFKQTICITFAIQLFAALVCAQESPFDGAWKINLTDTLRSQEKPYTWVIQNGTYQCSACPDGLSPIDIKADGTDQPVQGRQNFDTLAIKVVNDKTIEVTEKKDGKVVEFFESTISEDGKTLMANYKQPTDSKAPLFRVAAGPAGSHALSGTWSPQYRPQNLPSLTVTFKSSPDGLMFMLSMPISSPGISYDAKFDGKDYPIKGDTAGSTVSLKKVNDRSIEVTKKQDGKIMGLDHITVSNDGKALIIKSDEQGNSQTLTGIRALSTPSAVMDNPFVGTWKLNVEKSKFSNPAPKSSTVTFFATEDGLIFEQETVESTGKVTKLRAGEPFDGREGASVFPGITAISTRVDSNTIVLVFKKDGNEVHRVTEYVSKDGKTLTRTNKEKNAEGIEQEGVSVFEKQQ
jgi:hypothetical protein